MKRHKKGTVCSGQERKKAAAQRKAKQAAKEGGGSGEIGDIGGWNIVEGRRSNADTLGKASDHHQNRIVVARWQQSRKQCTAAAAACDKARSGGKSCGIDGDIGSSCHQNCD